MKRYQILIVTIFVLVVLSIGNHFLQKSFQGREADRKEVFKKDLEKWERLKKDSPTYRDSYVQLAFGYMQLGLISQARENLQKARQLDPDWQVPRELLQLLP